MKNTEDKIVYVAKAMFRFGKLGLDIVQKYFQNIIIIPYDEYIQGEEGKHRIRDQLREIEYDYLISFWSELYITPQELQKAKKGAINIHPAPPEHPGLGMFTFVRLFPHLRSHHGVVLHEMDSKFDHGKIYSAIRFPVSDRSDIELISHTEYLTLQLLESACQILATGKMTSALQDKNCMNEKWSNSFYTAAMEQEWLNQLPKDHLIRRLDCTTVDNAMLYLEFGAPHDSIEEKF